MSILLDPGDAHEVRIHARRRWNETGVMLVEGQTFALQATGTWTDFLITRDANGFTTEEAPAPSRKLLRKYESRRRMPHESWFALIGAIDRDGTTAFRIGTALNYTAERSGELTCFANDVPAAYWNNRGSILMIIRRVT